MTEKQTVWDFVGRDIEVTRLKGWERAGWDGNPMRDGEDSQAGELGMERRD